MQNLETLGLMATHRQIAEVFPIGPCKTCDPEGGVEFDPSAHRRSFCDELCQLYDEMYKTSYSSQGSSQNERLCQCYTLMKLARDALDKATCPIR